ncbi:MAG: GNAT family N-acetyltransferase [Candidatus Azobacteroides sp.]|nr:GNAT family N-acetyltransferase [Candidatus Azobacteroides sp.]
MDEVIPKIGRQALKSELTPDKLFRKTNKSGNEIYLFTAHTAPNAMLEVGRLREIAFRYYGGGTGKSTDIDAFDTMDIPYKQLIVWDPIAEEIIGGYRFRCGDEITFDSDGQPDNIATAELFRFSPRFLNDYLPKTVELGRSFVSLDYQSTRRDSKGLFALDNLWDGLGALSVVDSDIRYFFGKVTMYNTYNPEARNMILYFLNNYFHDKDDLIMPVHPLQTDTDYAKMSALFTHKSYKDDYKILNTEVRKYGINIPPLVSAYMNLSPGMRVFGTAVNNNFGAVEETGVLIDIQDIFEDKIKRHIESFLSEKPSTFLLKRLKKFISKKFAQKSNE